MALRESDRDAAANAAIESVIWAHDEFTVPEETSRGAINAIVDEKVQQHVALLRREGWVLRHGVSLSKEAAGDGLSLINMNMRFVRVLGDDLQAGDGRAEPSKGAGSDPG